jgi:hypothetical protein
LLAESKPKERISALAHHGKWFVLSETADKYLLILRVISPGICLAFQMEKVGGRDAVGALQSYEVIENRPFLLTASHQYAAQNSMGFSAAFCAITPQSFPVNNGGVKLVLGRVVGCVQTFNFIKAYFDQC